MKRGSVSLTADSAHNAHTAFMMLMMHTTDAIRTPESGAVTASATNPHANAIGFVITSPLNGPNGLDATQCMNAPLSLFSIKSEERDRMPLFLLLDTPCLFTIYPTISALSQTKIWDAYIEMLPKTKILEDKTKDRACIAYHRCSFTKRTKSVQRPKNHAGTKRRPCQDAQSGRGDRGDGWRKGK